MPRTSCPVTFLEVMASSNTELIPTTRINIPWYVYKTSFSMPSSISTDNRSSVLLVPKAEEEANESSDPVCHSNGLIFFNFAGKANSSTIVRAAIEANFAIFWFKSYIFFPLIIASWCFCMFISCACKNFSFQLSPNSSSSSYKMAIDSAEAMPNVLNFSTLIPNLTASFSAAAVVTSCMADNVYMVPTRLCNSFCLLAAEGNNSRFSCVVRTSVFVVTWFKWMLDGDWMALSTSGVNPDKWRRMTCSCLIELSSVGTGICATVAEACAFSSFLFSIHRNKASRCTYSHSVSTEMSKASTASSVKTSMSTWWFFNPEKVICFATSLFFKWILGSYSSVFPSLSFFPSVFVFAVVSTLGPPGGSGGGGGLETSLSSSASASSSSSSSYEPTSSSEPESESESEPEPDPELELGESSTL